MLSPFPPRPKNEPFRAILLDPRPGHRISLLAGDSFGGRVPLAIRRRSGGSLQGREIPLESPKWLLSKLPSTYEGHALVLAWSHPCSTCQGLGGVLVEDRMFEDCRDCEGTSFASGSATVSDIGWFRAREVHRGLVEAGEQRQSSCKLLHDLEPDDLRSFAKVGEHCGIWTCIEVR